jgi:hypothetical protein
MHALQAHTLCNAISEQMIDSDRNRVVSNSPMDGFPKTPGGDAVAFSYI